MKKNKKKSKKKTPKRGIKKEKKRKETTKKKGKKKVAVSKNKKKAAKKTAIKKKVAMVKKRKEKENLFKGIQRTKIRVIGIGGGGGSIISEIAQRIKRVDFVTANTDNKALRTVPKKVKRFQFGENLTKGLGTGMNVELGEEAAESEKERIKKLFQGQDFCIIVACLGGGTGSGAGSVFAKISKNAGCLTYGIFTLPFSFEGEKKMEIAKEALLKIKPHLNAFSIIPNERIFQIIDKDTPLKEALSVINKRLADNLEGLIETIYLPGLINIDFADLKTVFEGKGKLAYLNRIQVSKIEGEASIRKLISSPLYPYDIKGARGILYNIKGNKEIRLSEVSEISKMILSFANKQAKIIFGVSQDAKLKDKTEITLLAVGCAGKGFSLKSKRKKTTEERKIKKITASRKKQRKIKKKNISFTKTAEKPKQVLLKKEKGFVPAKQVLPEIKEEKPKEQIEVNKPSTQKKQEKRISPIKIQKIEKKKEIPQKTIVEKKKSSQPEKEETSNVKTTIRRTALEVKKKIEEEEKELIEKEKMWETPAIFRRKENDKQTRQS